MKTTALVAALAVFTLNLMTVAHAQVVSTNSLPAAPELRALDAGVLVDFRGPVPTGKAAGQAHCAQCNCAKSKVPVDQLPNADPQHHCALCLCPVNKVPPDLPAGAGLEMVAPRGGTVSGQAVLRGQQLSGVKAVTPVLTGPGGAMLPATVRWLTRPAGGVFANIFSATPKEKHLQPVLVTVTAPADAAPGVYTGRLEVVAEGFKGGVGVKVEVMAWVLPAPQEWKLHTGLIQSPDTIALQYKVAPWSDEHLKLLEPSLRLLRDVGSESCYVFLTAESDHYARYSAVRWRDDTLDYTYFDKYLDAYQKMCDVPKTLTLQVWEGGYSAHLNATNSVKVTRIQPDGTMTNVFAPYYGTEGSEAFWKPVFNGIRNRLAKRGWQKTEVLLGVPRDTYPSEEAAEMFAKVAPGWRWRVFTHGVGLGARADGKLMLPNGTECGWVEIVTTPGFEGKRAHMTKIAEHPKRAHVFTAVCRGETVPGTQVWLWRDLPAANLLHGGQGVSQVGLDYWDLKLAPNEVPPGLKGGNLCQITGWAGFTPRHNASKSLTVPGPNGAEPMLEYEMFREGVQAAAAFAVARETEAGKAFAALLASCMSYVTNPHLHPPTVTDPAVMAHSRWIAALRELYKAAETK